MGEGGLDKQVVGFGARGTGRWGEGLEVAKEGISKEDEVVVGAVEREMDRGEGKWRGGGGLSRREMVGYPPPPPQKKKQQP